jgi:phthalate 4,5-dioxygenase reductase component
MLQLMVTIKSEIATGIYAFELRDSTGHDLPAFTAGAHIPVRLPNGRIRRYSLCNSPAERHRYCIAVKRDAKGAGGSMCLTDDIKVGDEISVAPPRNNFELKPGAPSYIFIAGGIGITPIRSMCKHLLETGGKPFKLYYFTQSPAMTAFREEFLAPEFRDNVVLHHDGGDNAQAFDLWPVLEIPKGAHLYCCGPKGLMDAVRDMTGHWSSAAVHFEDFLVGKTAHTAPPGTAFEVKLKNGETHNVPAGQSILDVLRLAGHNIASSCESGTCGTCRTGLLSGIAEHRDHVLGDHERSNTIMICVSRAKSAQLLLDL